MLTRRSEHTATRHLAVIPPLHTAAGTTADLPLADLPLSDESETLLGVVPLEDDGKLMIVVGRVVDADGAPIPGTAPPLHEDDPEDDLVVDRATWRVTVQGVRIDMTYQEFRLLDRLASNPGRVFTRTELLESVWGAAGDLQTRTIDVHIHRLRRKLGPLRDRLTTVRRVGYVYQRI
ncbi:winged helix-turn-helix domain-containing protein [Nocardiopsis sediminis]|uniref:Winged helix-turn-helix domain-containing protein n=1 Tax=Nocardiopsis sediminis TaxID=1778267 RepID=A0ABV8FML2_9ACTN